MKRHRLNDDGANILAATAATIASGIIASGWFGGGPCATANQKAIAETAIAIAERILDLADEKVSA